MSLKKGITLVLLTLFAFTLLFILSIHYVPSHERYFLKDHLSFNKTIITGEDIDYILKQSNDGDFYEKSAIKNDYIYRQLKEMGIIVSTEEEKKEEPEDLSQQASSVDESEPYEFPHLDNVILTGTVEIKEVYGPPGFGETPEKDQRSYQYFITTDMSKLSNDQQTWISKEILAMDDSAYLPEAKKSGLRMQIVDSDDINIKALIPNKVKVKCNLSTAITGNDHTLILAQITKIL